MHKPKELFVSQKSKENELKQDDNDGDGKCNGTEEQEQKIVEKDKPNDGKRLTQVKQTSGIL